MSEKVRRFRIFQTLKWGIIKQKRINYEIEVKQRKEVRNVV